MKKLALAAILAAAVVPAFAEGDNNGKDQPTAPTTEEAGQDNNGNKEGSK